MTPIQIEREIERLKLDLARLKSGWDRSLKHRKTLQALLDEKAHMEGVLREIQNEPVVSIVAYKIARTRLEMFDVQLATLQKLLANTKDPESEIQRLDRLIEELQLKKSNILEFPREQGPS